MFALFTIPNMTDVIASSTSGVSALTGNLYDLLIFLGVPIVLTVFGLTVWSIRKLVRGGASAVKGKRSKRGRGRRR